MSENEYAAGARIRRGGPLRPPEISFIMRSVLYKKTSSTYARCHPELAKDLAVALQDSSALQFFRESGFPKPPSNDFCDSKYRSHAFHVLSRDSRSK